MNWISFIRILKGKISFDSNRVKDGHYVFFSENKNIKS